MLHKNVPLGDNHFIQNWEVADSTERAALSVTEDDIGKVCRQVDNENFYILSDYSPMAWIQMISGAAVELSNVNTFTKAQIVAPVDLTDAATIAINAELSNNFEVLLTNAVGATRILGNPTNLHDGEIINKVDFISGYYNLTADKILASFRKSA
jgi:hypothetical protein